MKLETVTISEIPETLATSTEAENTAIENWQIFVQFFIMPKICL